jgi:hypothetical protein
MFLLGKKSPRNANRKHFFELRYFGGSTIPLPTTFYPNDMCHQVDCSRMESPWLIRIERKPIQQSYFG